MDSRELAGLAHLYLLISSIGLSRISHTLKTDEEKYGAHYVSEIFFHRAAGIALVLEERNFLETIRGEVFLWPIEIERNEARLYRGAAEIGNREANLIEAQSCYIVAGIKARKIIDNTENSKEVRASALMAFATAMIEQMMVVLELAEIGDEPIDDVAIRDPFEMSLNSMNLAWSQGCREWDRFDAGLARMMAVLDKRRDIQKERTLNELREKVLSRRKSLLGEIVEGEWDEQTKATARSRLESMQTFIY